MAHAQKPDLVFQRNGRVHLIWRGVSSFDCLAAEVCASAVVMVVTLDTPCSEVQCKTTGYPLHSHVSPSLSLPCVTVCHQVSTELYDPRQVKLRGQTSQNLTRYTNSFQQRYAARLQWNTCSALPGTHLQFAGQYAYPNMAVKITLTLCVTAVNYSCNPLIIEAFGRQLCLPPSFLTLSLCYITLFCYLLCNN